MDADLSHFPVVAHAKGGVKCTGSIVPSLEAEATNTITDFSAQEAARSGDASFSVAAQSCFETFKIAAEVEVAGRLRQTNVFSRRAIDAGPVFTSAGKACRELAACARPQTTSTGGLVVEVIHQLRLNLFLPAL